MRKNILIENWQMAFLENEKVCKENIVLTTPAEIVKGGYKTIKASVPGNFELDFMREGLLDDVYMGTNSIKTQKLENLHFYYFTEFEYTPEENSDAFLLFEGVDTIAEIFLDGEEIGFVENMLHAHRFSLREVAAGKHSLLVHIIPVTIYARQYDIPAMCFGLKYNHDGIMIRKPGSMYGWDIMPRLVSAGLWKPVSIEYLPKARIEDPFTYVASFWEGMLTAWTITTLKIQTEHDFIHDYRIVLKGKCGDSEFKQEFRPFNSSVKIDCPVHYPKLWWPKNYGEQNLYDMEISLLYNGVEVDKVTYRTGLRTVWLKRTSCASDDGDFCFIVNNQRIFVTGTNWVPCDAFPSRHDDYTLRDIEMVNDLGCNMIRCWGGNVYPSDVLYNYCDEHGIMIWQDFAIACGHYPDDDHLCALVKEEVKQVVKAKRNHPALVVWAGDNECDCFVVPGWESRRKEGEQLPMLNPNYNKLTREVILRELRNHDATRPYLPSSPYLDEEAFRLGDPAESHLWGPRDFFKSEFYKNADSHFASEMGYHGSPSPESIKKFIPAESMPKKSVYEICDNPDWLVHSAGMETCVEGNPYAYRNGLMITHVERLFGMVLPDLEGFAKQSQISQAEAKKFFVEHFRVAKWRKTGILWWNIIDGWPQVSDAIVDWYGCKKLAYSYIKRSQTPFCMMFDEPVDGKLELVATNDLQQSVSAEFTVVNLMTDETVYSGKVELDANGISRVVKIPEQERAFYLISWKSNLGEGKNHFVCSADKGWNFDDYIACMKKAGFYDAFEGFVNK